MLFYVQQNIFRCLFLCVVLICLLNFFIFTSDSRWIITCWIYFKSFTYCWCIGLCVWFRLFSFLPITPAIYNMCYAIKLTINFLLTPAFHWICDGYRNFSYNHLVEIHSPCVSHENVDLTCNSNAISKKICAI